MAITYEVCRQLSRERVCERDHIVSYCNASAVVSFVGGAGRLASKDELSAGSLHSSRNATVRCSSR